MYGISRRITALRAELLYVVLYLELKVRKVGKSSLELVLR